ncbi:MAG: aminopeptidase [Thermoanaerobacteraceae bacterium]|nr:aminopeptidase [Thermoanaerobacteraceae bacterium]
MAEKNYNQLAEKLKLNRKNGWQGLGAGERDDVFALAKHYMDFLNKAKTEREAVAEIVRWCQDNGFLKLEDAKKARPKAGERFYFVWKERSLILGIWGKQPLSAGFRLVGSHLDAPRLDLKPEPLYEQEGLGLCKTHYYGGIKKYQWTAVPLALHGVVYTAQGDRVSIMIGEDAGDPVFTITDLLPHLAKDQMKKKATEAVPGEALNIVVGSIPVQDEEVKEPVKLALLEQLYEQYGIVEEDFISAELELVPAMPARDLGLDRSLIAAYGQDDRICAYATLKALAGIREPEYLALGLFADKEEIGSVGITGMQSNMLEYLLEQLIVWSGETVGMHQLLGASQAISADVNAALDPTYPEVMDKHNAARLGCGVVLTKYTGAGGKYNANDAGAEYVAQIRQLYNKHGVLWQTGELGKVDQGGGGTIAQFLANKGIETIDSGPPILSMHAPLEIASKIDFYYTVKAYNVFLSGDK